MKTGRRGQALVETALGIMVVGAIFVAAEEFAEIGMVGLKVQEAAAAANWNATQGGMYMHHWPKTMGPFDQTATLVAAGVADAQSRYQDFDGLTAVNRGTTLGAMYTDASGLTINCATNQAPRAGLGVQQGTAGNPLMGTSYPIDAAEDNNGVACSAEATVNANAFFPHWYFDRGATQTGFATAVTAWAANNLKICSMGRPVGGVCTGRTVMMLDDWAGANSDETGVCLMLANPAFASACLLGNGGRFHRAATDMYVSAANDNGAGHHIGSDLALAVVGWSPIASSYPAPGQDETAFFMSVAGEESNFTQLAPPIIYSWPPGFPALFGNHYRVGGYGTSPGALPPASFATEYTLSYAHRHDCFLGKTCT